MDPVIIIMLFLTIKHFILDFLYQPPYQYMNKGTYGHLGGIVHSGQHVLATGLLYFLVPVSVPLILGIMAFEFIVHYHMDWFKMWHCKNKGYSEYGEDHLRINSNSYFTWLGIDQCVHGLTYVAILAILL